jgi:hypothetical protein
LSKLNFEDIYYDMPIKDLVKILYDKIGDLYSDEYKDGVFKLPRGTPKETQDIIASIYTLANILKMKVEDE